MVLSAVFWGEITMVLSAVFWGENNHGFIILVLVRISFHFE